MNIYLRFEENAMNTGPDFQTRLDRRFSLYVSTGTFATPAAPKTRR